MDQSRQIDSAPYAPPDHEFAYGESEHQIGHLYLPQDTRALCPTVVFLHGGCWRAEHDLKHVSGFCRALTKEGFAVWNLEYRRLDSGGGFPDTFHDVARGTAFLSRLAPEFLLDLSNVVIAGNSAGGQLALWMAAQLRRAGAGGPPQPFRFRKVVALAAVTDLVAGVQDGVCGAAIQRLLGGTPEERPEAYSSVSPMHLLPLGVPQVLVHGLEDTIVPPRFSKEYARKAERHGDEVSLILLDGVDHFEPIDPRSKAWSVVLDALS